MAEVNSRKEYLKRYLEDPKKSKSKKKRKKVESGNTRSGFKIVDEDIDIKKIEASFKDDDDESDEAPLVVSVIDERPEDVKVKEMYSCKHWKKLDNPVKVKSEKIDEPVEQYDSSCSPSFANGVVVKRRPYSEDDLLPPRPRERTADLSPCVMQKSPRSKNSTRRHDSDSDISPPRSKNIDASDSDLSPPRSKADHHRRKSDSSAYRNKTNDSYHEQKSVHRPRVRDVDTSDSDLSPPRSKVNDHHRKSDSSPPRNKTSDSRHEQKKVFLPRAKSADTSDSDLSPLRSKVNDHKQRDLSPPRSRVDHHHHKKDSSHPRNKTSGSHNEQRKSSPPRSKPKGHHSRLRDFSPPRKKADNSHHRQKDSYSSKSKRDYLHATQRDFSPPRRKENNSEVSSDSGKKSRSQMQYSSDSDFSPPREKTSHDTERYNLHNSEHHKKMQAHFSGSHKSSRSSSSLDKQHSQRKKKRNDSDSDSDSHSDKERNSSKRKNVPYSHHGDSPSQTHKSKSRGMEEESFLEPQTSIGSDPKKKLPTSTLSGMKAGLQDSASLQEEIRSFKHREKTALDELSDELSGRNAATISRDRNTGRKRNLKEERLKQKEKEKKDAEKSEKYLEWGKGLKQKDDQEKRLQEDLYEMSKPLARYVGDDDLERQLKDELKEGDPMLEYMKKKRQKNQPTATSNLPLYQGPPAPPNRFNVQPGYRWDGVDRSNGFEKRFFEKINSKKATEHQAYLWSIENM